MPVLVESPSVIRAAGTKPKEILEFIGRVNTGTQQVSIAHMKSPAGWTEPGQCPEFDEFTIVLKGILKVDTNEHSFEVREGQAIIVEKNSWVRYSTPYEKTEYIAVCLPAFSPQTVHRDQ